MPKALQDLFFSSSVGRKKSFPISRPFCWRKCDFMLAQPGKWDMQVQAFRSLLCVINSSEGLCNTSDDHLVLQAIFGVGWVSLQHPSTFSPENLGVIELRGFAFGTWALPYKIFWQDNPVKSRLGRKDFRA